MMFQVYEYTIMPRTRYLATNGVEVKMKGKRKLLRSFGKLEDARTFTERHNSKTFIEFSPEAIQAMEQELEK